MLLPPGVVPKEPTYCAKVAGRRPSGGCARSPRAGEAGEQRNASIVGGGGVGWTSLARLARGILTVPLAADRGALSTELDVFFKRPF